MAVEQSQGPQIEFNFFSKVTDGCFAVTEKKEAKKPEKKPAKKPQLCEGEVKATITGGGTSVEKFIPFKSLPDGTVEISSNEHKILFSDSQRDSLASLFADQRYYMQSLSKLTFSSDKGKRAGKKIEEPIPREVIVELRRHALFGSSDQELANILISIQKLSPTNRDLVIQLIKKFQDQIKSNANNDSDPANKQSRLGSLLNILEANEHLQKALIAGVKNPEKNKPFINALSHLADTESIYLSTGVLEAGKTAVERFDKVALAHQKTFLNKEGKLIDPYLYIRNSLNDLSSQPLFNDKNSPFGKRFDETITFLGKASAKNRLAMLKQDALDPSIIVDEAVKRDINDNLAQAVTSINLQKISFPDGKSASTETLLSWLSSNKNFSALIGNIASAIAFRKEGKKITFSPIGIIKSISLINSDNPNFINKVLGTIVFLHYFTPPKSIELWNGKDFESYPIVLEPSSPINFVEAIAILESAILTGKIVIPTVNPAPAKQVPPVVPVKAEPAPSLKLEPTPSSKPSIPPISKFNLIAPWVLDASFCVAGIGLLASGLTAGDRANQGDYGQGDKASIVSGSMLIGACGGGLIGGGIEKLIRNKTGSGNSTSIWVAHGAGAVAGILLGTVSLSRFSAIDPTGGKNNPSNPGTSYGSLRNNLRDFKVVFPLASGRF